jgi:sugar phosphate isomerase/epimerase
VLQLRLGVNVAGLGPSLRVGLETAARLGVPAVEINARTQFPAEGLSQTGIRQIRKWLADYSLRVCSLAYPTRRGYAEAAEIERRVEGTKGALKLAYELGAAIVVNQLGPTPSDRGTAAYRLLLDVLTDIGNYGQRVGARLALRTGAQSGEQLRTLLGELRVGGIAVDFDPGALLVNDHSPSAAVQELATDVVAVRACDGVRDLSQGRGVAVQLGRGSVDFAEIFSVLERNQFNGFVVVEGQPPDPVQTATDAVEFLKSMF